MDAVEAQVFQIRRRIFPKAAPPAKWDTWRQIRLGWKLAMRRTGAAVYAIEALTIFALGTMFGAVMAISALTMNMGQP